VTHGGAVVGHVAQDPVGHLLRHHVRQPRHARRRDVLHLEDPARRQVVVLARPHLARPGLLQVPGLAVQGLLLPVLAWLRPCEVDELPGGGAVERLGEVADPHAAGALAVEEVVVVGGIGEVVVVVEVGGRGDGDVAGGEGDALRPAEGADRVDGAQHGADAVLADRAVVLLEAVRQHVAALLADRVVCQPNVLQVRALADGLGQPHRAAVRQPVPAELERDEVAVGGERLGHELGGVESLGHLGRGGAQGVPAGVEALQGRALAGARLDQRGERVGRERGHLQPDVVLGDVEVREARHREGGAQDRREGAVGHAHALQQQRAQVAVRLQRRGQHTATLLPEPVAGELEQPKLRQEGERRAEVLRAARARVVRAGEVRQPQLQKRHLGPETHTQQRVTDRSGSRDGLDCACARFKVGSSAGKLEGMSRG